MDFTDRRPRASCSATAPAPRSCGVGRARDRWASVLGADGRAAEILHIPAGGTAGAGLARHRRRPRPLRPDAERPRGLQAGGDGDGGRVPALLEKSGHSIRRRRPADPPPGERADHARGRRPARHRPRDRRSSTWSRSATRRPPRSRSRSTGRGGRDGFARAISSSSRRSAPGWPGGPTSSAGRTPGAVTRDLAGRRRHRAPRAASAGPARGAGAAGWRSRSATARRHRREGHPGRVEAAGAPASPSSWT